MSKVQWRYYMDQSFVIPYYIHYDFPHVNFLWMNSLTIGRIDVYTLPFISGSWSIISPCYIVLADSQHMIKTCMLGKYNCVNNFVTVKIGSAILSKKNRYTRVAFSSPLLCFRERMLAAKWEEIQVHGNTPLCLVLPINHWQMKMIPPARKLKENRQERSELVFHDHYNYGNMIKPGTNRAEGDYSVTTFRSCSFCASCKFSYTIVMLSIAHEFHIHTILERRI